MTDDVTGGTMYHDRGFAGFKQGERNGWLDISTAPKDGRDVWACDNEHGYTAKMAFNDQGEWECVDYGGGWMNVGFYPTHWMPVFPLPRQES